MLKPLWIKGACLSVVALLATGSAYAADTPAPKRTCFWVQNVNGWSAADDHTVYLRTGVKDVYRLDLMGACQDITWNQDIGLISHGSSSICSPLDATIVSKGPLGPQRCPVRAVTKLTPDQIAAMPSKHRP